MAGDAREKIAVAEADIEWMKSALSSLSESHKELVDSVTALTTKLSDDKIDEERHCHNEHTKLNKDIQAIALKQKANSVKTAGVASAVAFVFSMLAIFMSALIRKVFTS